MKTDTLHPSLFSPLFDLSHPPPPLSFFPSLSPSSWGVRGKWGKSRVGHSFSSPLSFTLLKEKNLPYLPPCLLPYLVLLPLLSLPFLAVTLRAFCYLRVSGYGEPVGVWRLEWEEVRGRLTKLQEWKQGCFIHPFIVMVLLVFLR